MCELFRHILQGVSVSESGTDHNVIIKKLIESISIKFCCQNQIIPSLEKPDVESLFTEGYGLSNCCKECCNTV
jgi:hypothetical protein